MNNGVNLLVATVDKDIIAAIRNGLSQRPYIDSIETVAFPSDTERKISRNGINVLIWDIDSFPQDQRWSSSVQRKHTLYIMYVSVNGGKQNMPPLTGNDVFLQKPFVTTHLMTARFVTSVAQHLDTMVKRKAPPSMRELNKMVNINDRQKIVAIGSSTGGTNALEDLLKQFPPNIPPIVVVQHMPSGFTKLFADRLNTLYPQEIKEAQTGDFLMHGRMLIAPADRHMRIIKQQGRLAVECYVGNRIHGVMPAADVLFESIANEIGSNAVGVILTGMGSDGAKGLLQMKAAGCKNIGQNKETCVVYGMPKAANDIGALAEVLPLGMIPSAILRLVNG